MWFERVVHLEITHLRLQWLGHVKRETEESGVEDCGGNELGVKLQD